MNWKKLLSNERIKRSSLTDIRNEFESDFGRIIFSPALRRMHDKTQVFPLTTDDNIHSRLTHSNEVMSIGYTFGLKLCKSQLIQHKTGKSELELFRILPILLQNVCFIHDIGNAPFGHFGETIVSDYFKKLEKEKHPNFSKLTPRQKRDFFNYDGNAQGLRVLTKLQYLDNPFGLNLTYATLASYLKYPNHEEINTEKEKLLQDEGEFLKEKNIECSKHGVFYSEEKYFNLIVKECELINDDERILRHPLCYLMEAADSIAYVCMDMEDGFNKSLFDINYIKDSFKDNFSKIAQDIIEICNDELSDSNTKIVNIRIKLIAYFVELAYNNFESHLEKIENGNYNLELVKQDNNKIYKILEDFSVKKIFTSREINYLESTGYSVFKGLLDFYIDFIFNNNKKYVQRAKSLISQSIISTAIEENLIDLCEQILKKEKEKINKGLEKFIGNSEHIENLQQQNSMLEQKILEFEILKKEYNDLFFEQFKKVLNKEEITKLKLSKKKICKLLDPKFENLDDYSKFRIILDFISGMTDQYALNHYQKISGQRIN